MKILSKEVKGRVYKINGTCSTENHKGKCSGMITSEELQHYLPAIGGILCVVGAVVVFMLLK